VPSYVGYGRILPNPDGQNLWFVQEYGAAYDVFNLAQETWAPGPPLACRACVPLKWDDQGRLWGGGSTGLWIIDGQKAQQFTTAKGLPSDDVRAVGFANDGTVWVGTSAGVAVYDDQSQSIDQVYTAAGSGLADDQVNHVLGDSAGGVWVATVQLLSYFNPNGEWQHFTESDFQGQAIEVTGLAEDGTGAIWVATYQTGLYRYQGGVWTHYGAGDPGVALNRDSINSADSESDGSVWFGLNYGGAAHYDGQTWESFDVDDGLVHSNVNAVYVADTGDIWFAASGGISRYRP
jgi:ligand-binding sensor domain-containing protein